MIERRQLNGFVLVTLSTVAHVWLIYTVTRGRTLMVVMHGSNFLRRFV